LIRGRRSAHGIRGSAASADASGVAATLTRTHQAEVAQLADSIARLAFRPVVHALNASARERGARSALANETRQALVSESDRAGVAFQRRRLTCTAPTDQTFLTLVTHFARQPIALKVRARPGTGFLHALRTVGIAFAILIDRASVIDGALAFDGLLTTRRKSASRHITTERD
jgi:hypothetical protein